MHSTTLGSCNKIRGLLDGVAVGGLAVSAGDEDAAMLLDGVQQELDVRGELVVRRLVHLVVRPCIVLDVLLVLVEGRVLVDGCDVLLGEAVKVGAVAGHHMGFEWTVQASDTIMRVCPK